MLIFPAIDTRDTSPPPTPTSTANSPIPQTAATQLSRIGSEEFMAYSILPRCDPKQGTCSTAVEERRRNPEGWF